MHQTETVMSQDEADVLAGNACRTITARDPDELARHLTGWHQVYDQISCGVFSGSLDEMRLPRLQVFRERISQSVHQSCRIRPDAIWFGLPLAPAAIRINGRQLDAASVMVRPGDTGFELVTPESHEIHGIVVCRDLLETAAARTGGGIDLSRLESAEILRVDPDRRDACVRALAGLLAARHDVALCGMESAHRQDSALDALLDMLDNSQVEAAAAGSLQRRQRIVARARDFIRAHRGQSIMITDLCEQTHVSRRTLQYCFEDVLGMSPLMYLRRFRLNGIRRELLAGESRAIGDVAAEWGFDNFSQFSCDYRKLFGESATSSLRRRRLSRHADGAGMA